MFRVFKHCNIRLAQQINKYMHEWAADRLINRHAENALHPCFRICFNKIRRLSPLLRTRSMIAEQDSTCDNVVAVPLFGISYRVSLSWERLSTTKWRRGSRGPGEYLMYFHLTYPVIPRNERRSYWRRENANTFRYRRSLSTRSIPGGHKRRRWNWKGCDTVSLLHCGAERMNGCFLREQKTVFSTACRVYSTCSCDASQLLRWGICNFVNANAKNKQI